MSLRLIEISSSYTNDFGFIVPKTTTSFSIILSADTHQTGRQIIPFPAAVSCKLGTGLSDLEFQWQHGESTMQSMYEANWKNPKNSRLTTVQVGPSF